MRATLHDVAKAAGVSITTVSYVLNNKGSIAPQTRARVKAAIVALGYRRQGVSGGNLGLIGDFSSSMLSALHLAAAEYGFALHTVLRGNGEPSQPAQKPLAGMILYGGLWDRAFLESIAEQYPTVLLGNWLPTVPTDAVWVDNAGGVYVAVHHLVAQGHRKIGLINGPSNSATSAEKAAGFRSALQHAGGAATGTVVEAKHYEQEAGMEATRALLDQAPDITSLIAGETNLGLAALAVCHERGIAIPEDLSLIVFRDRPELAQTRPPLTSIPIPEKNIAKEAIARLIHRIQNPLGPGQRVLIQPQLHDRQSVLPPKRG